MTDILGEVDICIVMDTTGSMGMYIDEAKRHALAETKRVAESGDLDIRLAVVEYRDHPPEDVTFIARAYPFGSGVAFQAALNSLRANGGGDHPEAVWDGVKAGADLDWRPNADHLMFLIGDAPPHGAGGFGDGFKDGCPCGMTGAGLAEVLSMKRIRLYAHSIAGDSIATREFKQLAEASGGNCTEVDRPTMATVSYTGTLDMTSEIIGASRSYTTAFASVSAAHPDWDADMIAANASSSLGWTVERTSGVVNYMNSRGISVEEFRTIKGTIAGLADLHDSSETDQAVHNS